MSRLSAKSKVLRVVEVDKLTHAEIGEAGRGRDRASFWCLRFWTSATHDSTHVTPLHRTLTAFTFRIFPQHYYTPLSEPSQAASSVPEERQYRLRLESTASTVKFKQLDDLMEVVSLLTLC